MTVFQGDFGKGVDTGSGVFSDLGANPCTLSPAVTASGMSSGGIPQLTFRPGQVMFGSEGSEFVYGKLVLAATTDVLPGQAYQLDKDYSATLLVNSSSVLNGEVAVLNVWSPGLLAGTYYGWFQRAGHCAVQAAASSVAGGYGETTATAGQLKFPATATTGMKSIAPCAALLASSGVTFTGTTLSGAPYITGVSSINGLQLGQVITGTNLPSNAIVAAIDKLGGNWRISIGTNTSGSYNVLQNATGSASGTTFTVTNMVAAVLNRPLATAQN